MNYEHFSVITNGLEFRVTIKRLWELIAWCHWDGCICSQNEPLTPELR